MPTVRVTAQMRMRFTVIVPPAPDDHFYDEFCHRFG